MKLEQFKKYKCKIKLRKTYKGQALKSEAIPHNAKVLVFFCDYLMDDEDKYPNEFVMTPVERLVGLSWIASGDLKIIKEVK